MRFRNDIVLNSSCGPTANACASDRVRFRNDIANAPPRETHPTESIFALLSFVSDPVRYHSGMDRFVLVLRRRAHAELPVKAPVVVSVEVLERGVLDVRQAKKHST